MMFVVNIAWYCVVVALFLSGVVKCNSNVDVFESVNPVYYDGKYNCRDGFTRNRTECSDLDECIGSLNRCHGNATCFNTPGSYYCLCNEGYVGNGEDCFDVEASELSGKYYHNITVGYIGLSCITTSAGVVKLYERDLYEDIYIDANDTHYRSCKESFGDYGT